MFNKLHDLFQRVSPVPDEQKHVSHTVDPLSTEYLLTFQRDINKLDIEEAKLKEQIRNISANDRLDPEEKSNQIKALDFWRKQIRVNRTNAYIKTIGPVISALGKLSVDSLPENIRTTLANYGQDYSDLLQSIDDITASYNSLLDQSHQNIAAIAENTLQYNHHTDRNEGEIYNV